MTDTIEIEVDEKVAGYLREIADAEDWTLGGTVNYVVRSFAQRQIEEAAKRNSGDGE